MRLEQIRYFIQVVESHSFNQAAKNLFITQPALTAAMNALEDELQVKLLKRSNKGAFPTQYGLQVYNDCKTILQSLEEKINSWKMLSTNNHEEIGVVNLSAIPAVCNYMMEHIIWGIRNQYPKIDLILHEVNMNKFLNQFKQMISNIGITSIMKKDELNFIKQNAPHFDLYKLLDDEYQIFISAQHPFAEKETLSVEDCTQLEFAIFSDQNRSSSINQEVFQIFKPKEIHYLNNRENIIQAIVENKVASFFLYTMTKNNWYMKNGFMCSKPIKNIVLLPSSHYLISSKDIPLSGAEQIVCDFIKTNYQIFYNHT